MKVGEKIYRRQNVENEEVKKTDRLEVSQAEKLR